MATAVLIPIDGSPLAERALSYVVGEYPDTPVHLLYVMDHVESFHDFDWTSLPSHVDDHTRRVSERGQALLADARASAETAGLDVVETELSVGRPATGIVDYAERTAVDHIVMGSHGRNGLTRFILGSVAEQVLRRSTVPVTIVR